MNEQQIDLEQRGWQRGLLDAAHILSIYPEGADTRVRYILDEKRREILRTACIEEPKPTNPQRLGDGVTAETLGNELRLSVRNGNENDNTISECVIVMSKETCEGLGRYMWQHVLCREP